MLNNKKVRRQKLLILLYILKHHKGKHLTEVSKPHKNAFCCTALIKRTLCQHLHVLL